MVDVVVEYEYVGIEEDELSLKVGDIITNVDKQDGGWWEGELNGKRGMFPDNFVKEIKKDKGSKETSGPTPAGHKKTAGGGGGHVAELANKLGKGGGIHMGPRAPGVIKRGDANKRKLRAKAAYSYTPENDDELHLEVGDVIEITKQEEAGWWEGSVNGKLGVFPSNFVEVIEDEAAEKAQAGEEDTQQGEERIIHGKKIMGVGLGNIFSEGPIKLRSTSNKSNAAKSSREDLTEQSAKKKVPPPVPKDVPSAAARNRDSREHKYFIRMCDVPDIEPDPTLQTSQSTLKAGEEPFIPASALAQYIERKVAALSAGVQDTSHITMGEYNKEDLKQRLASIMPLAMISRGRLEPLSGSSTPRTLEREDEFSSDDETKPENVATVAQRRQTREKNNVPGFFPFEVSKEQDEDTGFDYHYSKSYIAKSRIPGFFTLPTDPDNVQNKENEEDTTKEEDSIKEEDNLFEASFPFGLNESTDRRLAGFFQMDNAEYDAIASVDKLHDEKSTVEKQFTSLSFEEKGHRRKSWEGREERESLYSPVIDSSGELLTSPGDEASPHYQWSQRELGVIPEESELCDTTPKQAASLASSVFVTPSESCVVNIEEEERMVVDRSINKSYVSAGDESFLSVLTCSSGGGSTTFVSPPSTKSDAGIASDNSFASTDGTNPMVSTMSHSGDSGNPKSPEVVPKLILSPRNLSGGDEMLRLVLSPRSQSSMEDVPLELSGLSQARTTPPPKMTFRKKRSLGGLRGSPSSPLYRSTPTSDENPPMKKKKGVERAFMEPVPWTSHSPFSFRPSGVDKEVQTPTGSGDETDVGIARQREIAVRHVGVECDDLMLESYVSEPSIVAPPTLVAQRSVGTEVDFVMNHTGDKSLALEDGKGKPLMHNVSTMAEGKEKPNKSVSFFTKDVDIDRDTYEYIFEETLNIPESPRNPGASNIIEGGKLTDSILITKKKFWGHNKVDASPQKKRVRNKGVQTSKRLMKRVSKTSITKENSSPEKANKSEKYGNYQDNGTTNRNEELVGEMTEVKQAWPLRFAAAVRRNTSRRRAKRSRSMINRKLAAGDNNMNTGNRENQDIETLQGMNTNPRGNDDENDAHGSLPTRGKKSKGDRRRRMSLPMFISSSNFWKPRSRQSKSFGVPEETIVYDEQDDKENFDEENGLFLENDVGEKSGFQPPSEVPSESVSETGPSLTYMGTLKRMGRLPLTVQSLVEKYNILQPNMLQDNTSDSGSQRFGSLDILPAEPRDVMVGYVTDSSDSVFVEADSKMLPVLTMNTSENIEPKKKKKKIKKFTNRASLDSKSADEFKKGKGKKTRKNASFGLMEKLRNKLSPSSERSAHLMKMKEDATVEKWKEPRNDSSDQEDADITITESNTAEPLGLGNTAEPLGLENTAEPLGLENTAEPLGLGNIAEPLGLENTAEPLGLENTAEPLGLENTAEPLGLENTAEPLGLDNKAEPLGLDNTAEPLGLENTAEPLGMENVAYRVTEDTGETTEGEPFLCQAIDIPEFREKKTEKEKTESEESRQSEYSMAYAEGEDVNIIGMFYDLDDTEPIPPVSVTIVSARVMEGGESGDMSGLSIDPSPTELLHMLGLDTEDPVSPFPGQQVDRIFHGRQSWSHTAASLGMASESDDGRKESGSDAEMMSSQGSFSLDSIEAIAGSFALDVGDEGQSVSTNESLVLADSTESFEKLMADTSQNAQFYYSLTQELSPSTSGEPSTPGSRLNIRSPCAMSGSNAGDATPLTTPGSALGSVTPLTTPGSVLGVLLHTTPEPPGEIPAVQTQTSCDQTTNSQEPCTTLVNDSALDEEISALGDALFS